ncbi:MAG TPA: lytic murein transglycosylase B [Burkholderiales bacterium]|nr:lytic murein transglycosylase B [Burkholderiales bacterium]
MKAVVGLVACLGLALGCVVHCDAQTAPEAGAKLRPEIDKFIAYMAETHGFNARDLRALFAKVQPSQDVTRAMTAPSTAKPWYEFKPLFVDQARISAGVKFWNDNAEVLAQARGEFGVPEAIVVALIGVETRYGRNSGGFRVMDTLTTLAFDWPSRRDFFRRELEQFLLLAREQGWDPLMIKGSFAGAMGMPQFMPGSYRRYAIDYDKDGRIDLWRDPADVIGSVASYLREFGWKDGEPVVAPARVGTPEWRALLDLGLKPSLTLDQWKLRGVDSAQGLPDALSACLFSIDLAGGVEFWFGFENFYALLQYNRSRNYAMAIVELAREIALERERLSPLPGADAE